MRTLILILLLSAAPAAQSLPDAPSVLCARSPEVCKPVVPGRWLPDHNPNPGFWVWGADLSESEWPLRTNRELLHNRPLLLMHAAWLASFAYDAELTHAGVAHHNCIEGGLSEAHPSRGELYRGDIPEFAVGTVFGIVMAKYVWEPLALIFPVVGGTMHIQGGTEWLLKCW